MSIRDQEQGYQLILTKLFQDQDSSSAISLTLERDNAYSFYKYCRQKAIACDANRHPKYLQRVREFQHVHYSPQDPEWELLNTLMESPLRTQYRVETSRKPYLPDQRDEALKQINCMPEIFYQYLMPEWVVERAIEQQSLQREMRHTNPPTISDLQTFLAKMQNWRELSHPWDLVSVALLVCGRRIEEVISTLQWEAESNYVIRVRGITKQARGEGSVPILLPYRDFDELMARIREHRLPNTSTTHRLKPAFQRVFGQWYPHGHRRNIYCELGYRLRHQSGFFPDISRVMWFDKALCHDTNVIHQATNLTYQTLNFKDE